VSSLSCSWDLSGCNFSLIQEKIAIHCQHSSSYSDLYLSQTIYITKLLLRTQFQDAKSINSHVPAGRKLSLYDADPLPDASMYRSIVGAIQYITFTRADLSFAVNQVCQFMHQPSSSHWMAVKRILCYLKKIPTHGLLYKPGALSLQGFLDADYDSDPDDRHSTDCYCIYLGGCPIPWSTKKHRTISRSGTEAEYRQLAYTVTEISWLHSLFRDLHISLITPIICCDNISSISFTSNPIFHSKIKHLEIDYHYVRDKVVRRELHIRYIHTADQVADIFTKGLSSARFALLSAKLTLRECPISLRVCDRKIKSLPDSSTKVTSDQIHLVVSRLNNNNKIRSSRSESQKESIRASRSTSQ